ncbi:MAG: hypothetical protein IAC13_05860 [Firmicutes bacterium]|uniref:Uncharacterized protein n=1 Tax=Candidatus Scybalomonas excrementavium TaxID=2840943 RepID=A0A9D9N7M8_9FIRM|nr:hypothetical protein [Candidatus Scybalomonas excrementavium]
MGINLFYIMLIIVSIILFIKSYKRYKKEREECQFLKDFLNFVQKVKQVYFATGMIEDAIFEVLYDMKDRVLLEGEKIYEVLCSNKEEVRKQYMQEQKNPFVKLFGSLVYMEMEYGTKEDKNTFLECIQLLQQDIVIEIWKKEKIQALFGGLSFLILFPGFFLKSIEQWGILNLPELSKYYRGTFGIWALVSIFFVVLMTWWLIEQIRFFLQKDVKEEKKPSFLEYLEEKSVMQWVFKIWEQSFSTYYEKEKKKLQSFRTILTPEQFLLKKFLIAMVLFFLSILITCLFLSSKQAQALEGKELWGIEEASSTGLLSENWQKGVLYVGEKYKEEKEIDEEQIWQELYEYYNKTNFLPAKVGVLQVKQNLEQYQKSKWTLQKFFLVILIGCIGWKIPNWILWYEAILRKYIVEHEFIHYETVLIFLSEKTQLDVIKILEWMEEGGMVYKDILQWCWLSSYEGEEEAFLELREYGKSEKKAFPFISIADGFLLSDKIGLKKAFEDREVHRKNGQEQRKQENERNVQKYGMIAQMISFFPLSFIIGVYLILPFLMESMVQLSEFLQQMQT